MFIPLDKTSEGDEQTDGQTDLLCYNSGLHCEQLRTRCNKTVKTSFASMVYTMW